MKTIILGDGTSEQVTDNCFHMIHICKLLGMGFILNTDKDSITAQREFFLPYKPGEKDFGTKIELCVCRKMEDLIQFKHKTL
jgi:histidinol phosphatase-like PHP family hydrolase